MAADPDTRARTHMANERTFLAWFRTGLTVMALGLAAGQFLARDVTPGVPIVQVLATILVAIGAFLVTVGIYRYQTNRERVDRVEFRPASRSVVLAGVAALVAAVVAIAFVWVFPTT